MPKLLIKAKEREKKNPNIIRSAGYIPATVYGHGFDSQSVQVDAKEFSKIPHRAYSHINQLVVDDKEKYDVLIRDVQVDPVLDNCLSIQFYRIKSDEKIKVKVPLNYVGHSPAVTLGGVLIVSLNEIEIQCLPKDIPDVIEINLEQIQEIGQGVQVKDLKVSKDISILAKADEVLAKVEVAKTHEIEEAVPEVAPGEVPVEGAAPAAAEGTSASSASAKEAAPPAKGKEK